MRSFLAAQFHMKTHWKMISIGMRGAGFYNHTNTIRTSSWHAQLMGRNWWYICGQLANGSQACFEDIVETGEVVFHGQDSIHESQNLDSPTISITNMVVEEHNFMGFNTHIWEKCVGGKHHTFMFSSALCDALDVCFEQMYEQCEYEAG